MSLINWESKILYGLVLLLMVALMLASLGGGIWGQSEPWILQWQHSLFSSVCHQQADRSFWIAGQPMAVCARCAGIYGMFTAGWILVPFFAAKIQFSKKEDTKFLAIIFLLNVIDVIGNLLGIWQNTLISRLLAGSLLGFATAICIGETLIKQHQSLTNGKQHGTTRTA